jgi:glycosyltransferase involved in cell wall biosynthesis
MPDMDISVVIPSYNRADLLPFTIDAVLAQTLPPQDIIVVDDGSKDNSLAVIAGYQPRVQIIQIKNAGSLVARNVGLKAAKAPIVAFCDSDDLWRPDFLQRMAILWRAEPRMKVAYSNFRIVRADIWETGTKFDAAPPGYWNGLHPVIEDMGFFDQPIVDRMIRWQPFFQSALVVNRASMLAAGGWDEGVGRIVGDDFGTVLRLGELHPFGVMFTPLVGIRKHAGNFSANVRTMNLGDAAILEYALASRASLRPYAASIRDSAHKRRSDALDSAFVDRDFAAVRTIYQLLPASYRSERTRLKHLVASLPGPLAGPLARAVHAIRSGRD